jgi:hypothetical protein
LICIKRRKRLVLHCRDSVTPASINNRAERGGWGTLGFEPTWTGAIFRRAEFATPCCRKQPYTFHRTAMLWSNLH